MNDNFEWTDAAIGQLEALWGEGHSTAEIARRMGLSKNAVVGKAHRLNLPARPSPIRVGGVKQPAKPRAAGKVTLAPLSSVAAPVVAPVPAPARAVPPPELRPIAAVVDAVLAPMPAVRQAVRAGQECCWPMGDPRSASFRWCGAAAMAGRQYCAAHWRAAHEGRPALPASAVRAARGLALLIALFAGGLAQAAPPARGSEQWEILAPHRAWVEGVAGPQGTCCSLADGRAVEARRQGDRWQVLFPAEAGFPQGWQDVPEAAVLGGENPVGMPVAWWFQGQVRCFVPGSGT